MSSLTEVSGGSSVQDFYSFSVMNIKSFVLLNDGKFTCQTCFCLLILLLIGKSGIRSCSDVLIGMF